MFSRESADNDWTFTDARGMRRARVNADFSAYSLWSVSRFDASPRVRVLSVFHGYYREQGTPGRAALPDEQARTTSDRLLGAVNVQVDCGRAPGGDDCALELVTSALRTTSQLADPLREVIPASHAWASGDRLEQSARLLQRLSRTLSLVPSVTLARERIDAGYTGQSAAIASRLLLRPGLGAELQLGPATTLLGAAALERDQATSDASGERAAVLSPVLRFGVKTRLTEWLQVRANIGHFGRTPTLGELYGVSASVRGNASLRAERGPSADLGLRVHHDARRFRFQADVFAFAREASQLIAYRQTGPATVSPYNVGRARLVGVESAVALELLDCLALSGVATLLDPRSTTDERSARNDILPFRSRLVAVAEAEAFVGEPFGGRAVTRLAAGARLLHRSSKYADSAGLLIVPRQTVLDLHATAILWQQTFALRVALHNALNGRELDSIGQPLSGRSFHLGVEARWP
jgi:iron complex outermembrane receptor protein